MSRFGREDFVKVTMWSARMAFQRYCSGVRNALIFEPVSREILSQGYRYSPRIYANKPIGEIARNINDQSFILRYISPADRDRALLWMSRIVTVHGAEAWIGRSEGGFAPSLAA